MHSARIEHSPRLQRVSAVLGDGLAHSTRDIMLNANVCAVNSCVSELRDNGVGVRCWVKDKVFWYQKED